MASSPDPEAAAGTSARHPLFLWLRVGLGAAILVAVTLWVVGEGAYLRNLSLEVVAVSTVLSIFTALLHARTLQVVAVTYGRRLGYLDGLRISSLASMGNAAGGLPLGTALKFSVLRERVGLRLSEIAAGMATFTAGISLSLMLYATLSILGTEVPVASKALAVAAWAIAVAVIGSVGAYLARHHRLSALVGPFAAPRALARCVGLSFLVASSFILNACITGAMLLPAATLNHLLFVSSAGILLGLASFLQGVAGIQELAMALMAYSVGISATDGAQIALTLRATAIIASVAVLVPALLVPRARG